MPTRRSTAARVAATPKRATLASQALAVRRSRRAPARRPARLVHRHTAPPARLSPNYALRVMAGEFEPTALLARELAASRNESLHALAASLGFAEPPPTTRRRVVLSSIPRAELIALTGYSKSELSRFFARRHPPMLTKLARIAAAYGCWLDDLLTAVGW